MKTFLSAYQVVVLTSVSFLPLMFWVYPRDATEHAGIDGQWAVLGVCILGLVSAVIHGLLNERFAGCSASQMLDITFGRVAGKVISTLYIPGYLVFVAVSLFSFSVTLTGILPTTPRVATITTLVVVAISGARHGLETVARVASFVFPGTVIVLCSACLYVAARGSMTAITFYPASISNTLSGTAHLLPLFFGLNLFLVLNQHYLHKNNRSVKLILIATGISALTLILVYVATVLALSYSGIREVSRPVQFVMELAEIRGFIVERFGLVFICLVTLFETVFVSAHLWGVSKLVAELFNLRPIREKWIVLVLACAILVVFGLIKNQTQADFLLDNVLFPLSWLYLIIEPSVKLLLSYLLGRPKAGTVRQA